MRKIFRAIYYIVGTLVFVAIALAGFTQTKTFRSYLHSVVTEAVRAELHGDLEFGSLEGNLITGFHVSGLTLSESGLPVLTADRLEATYEPLGFLINRPLFQSIRLERPQINLVRSADGSWNVARLIPAASASEGTGDSTLSSTVINVRNIQIENAEVIMVDSVKLLAQVHLPVDSQLSVTDYPTLTLRGFNLTASIRLAPQRIQATVRHLSFLLDQPAFELARLSGEFSLGKSEVSVKELLVETSTSRVLAEASLKNVDIVNVQDMRELRNKPASLALSATRLDLADLKQLFPSALSFLDGAVSLQAKAAGTFGKLQIENLTVQTLRSLLRVEGTVANLHHPQDLEMDLVCLDNRIDPTEVHRYFPTVKFPGMQSIGPLTFNLRFTGTPRAFNVRLEGTSDAGRLDVGGSLQNHEGVLSYETTVKTYNLDLGKVFDDETLQSNVHSTISLKGAGTDLQTMTAVGRAEIDSSEFYGIPFTASSVEIDVAAKSVRSNIQLRSGGSAITLTGALRLDNERTPEYTLEGKISSFNLASILKDRQFESNLSFTLQAEGRGVSFRDMQTRLSVVFSPSVFAGQQFSEGWARAALNAAGHDAQTFHLTSSVADVDVEGKFQLDSFIATLHKGGVLLAEAIKHRIHSLDSLQRRSLAIFSESRFHSSLQSIPDPVAARFIIRAKDLYPIGVFLGQRLGGKGVVSGEVAGSLDSLRFSGTAVVNEFAYADSTVVLSIGGSDVLFRLDGISRATLLDSVHAEFTFTGSRINVNDLSLYQPAVSIAVRGTAGTFSMSALADSSVEVEAAGTSLYKDGFITYTLDTFKVNAQSYLFLNVEPVVLTLGWDGVRAENFWMRHESEEVKIAGSLRPGGDSDVEVDVTNFLLSNLQLFSTKKSFVQEVRDLGGLVNARGVLRGNLDNPNFTLHLAADGVRHGTTVFGQIETRASYLDRMLNVFVEFRSKPEQPALPPDFLLSGTLPYDLSLNRSAESSPRGEMNLAIRSTGLSLALVDPFIAELSNIAGTLVCDMSIRGTLDEPRYNGSMSLQSARFFLKPLGITYVLDGKFVPAGQKIALDMVRVKNIPQDRSDGAMDISGFLTLQGLKLKDFDLLADGQLLVMKESSRRPGQTIYGDLFVASGVNGLRWRGTLQRSVVSGAVRVKNANLTLPPAREQLLQTSRDVIITLVDDTSSVAGELSSREKMERTAGGASLAVNNGPILLTNGKPTVNSIEEREERSFLDRLVYDLDVETQGPTQVRFIFNPYTGEELFAELRGRMGFTKDGELTRLTGEVEVGERSYYNFLKRFQASGKLTFTGDLLNPELNILARYESVHQTADTSVATSERQDDRRVIVLLEITGTRREPKPKFEIEEVRPSGEHVKRTSGDIESDAIAFILTGSFRDELTQQERSSLLGSNLLYGLTSSVLSGPITDFMKKEFGFINSVDVIYYGGNVQSSTDLRVTGEVGEAVIRFGGRVFSDISNTNWSVQLPLGGVLGSEKWRNLIIEAERRVEGVESYEQRRESNGLRLIYRITF